MGSGTGSFRKKGNVYEFRIRIENSDGTNIQKSFTGPTKAACRHKYAEYLKRLDEQRIEEKTLGKYAEQWIEAKKSNVSYRTWKNYNNYLTLFFPNLLFCSLI